MTSLANPSSPRRLLSVLFVAWAASGLLGCGAGAHVQKPPRPAPAMPTGTSSAATPAPPSAPELASGGEAPGAPGPGDVAHDIAPKPPQPGPPPPEAPELQPAEGEVQSAPGEPVVVLENPPRGNDMGGLLGTPSGPVLVLHFTDVGQGDGAIIQSPGGKVVVVDTGPPPGCPRFIRYLGELEIHHIDLLINTHPHADHLGCSTEVMKEITVGAVMESGFSHPTPNYDLMLKQMEADKIPLKLARRGRNVDVDADVRLEILSPEDPLIHGSRSDANANSIVFRLVYKDISFLFMADAEEETEERLLRGDTAKLRATVLKVAHHGSAYASTSEFLGQVRPRLAVVSYGRNNVYGHPAPATMQRIAQAGARILKTAIDGNIVMVTDGARLQVWTIPRSGGPYGGARLWYPGRPAAPMGPHSGPDAVAAPKKVDLNHATEAELTRLPSIGKKVAAQILESRRTRGRFQKIEDLKRIKGFGDKRVERLRPYVLCGPGVTN